MSVFFIVIVNIVLLTSEGSLPDRHRVQHDGIGVGEKKAFIVRTTGKETEGRVQTCVPDPEFDFKGFQHRVFLDSGPFTSERVPALRFPSCSGPVVLWGEQLRVHKSSS